MSSASSLPVESLNVSLGDRSYPIHVGAGILSSREHLLPYLAGRQVMIVTNEVIAPHYLAALKATLADADLDIREVVLPDGEATKTLASVERSGLWVTDVEVLRLHYAETLRHWSERFAAERGTARRLYDERFCRIWEFYLAVCEMAFRNGRLMVFQIQLAKRRDEENKQKNDELERQRKELEELKKKKSQEKSIIGDIDFGTLYIGSADGGSGGDPLGTGQNLAVAFGKILRIDPLGSNSANGEYGIPEDNPYANDGRDDTVDEIYASGVRNPQRFNWDRQNGNLYVADIGQGIIEEISLVTRGANLGWNTWEGSFRFIGRREVSLTDPRGENGFTYPIAEWGHQDPLMLRPGPRNPRAAVTGVVVYRQDEVPQLTNRLIFGDNPSGEVFFVDADDLPDGGAGQFVKVIQALRRETPGTTIEILTPDFRGKMRPAIEASSNHQARGT